MGYIIMSIWLAVATCCCGYQCPYRCICNGDMMNCSKYIPDYPTSHVTRVYLISVNADHLKPGKFHRWENVTFLDMTVVKESLLRAECFTGLENLEHIGIHAEDLNDKHIGERVFRHLENVRTLDMSWCYWLTLQSITKTLNQSREIDLPLLERIIFVGFNTKKAEPLIIDKEFLYALTNGRNIKYIDLSETSVGLIDVSHFTKLCESLQYLKLQKVTIIYVKELIGRAICKQLRTIDVTFTILPTVKKLFEVEDYRFNCHRFSFFNAVETLIFSGILQSLAPVTISSNNFNVFDCCPDLKKLIGRKNGLKWLNISSEVNVTTEIKIVEMDFSDNVIQYIFASFSSSLRHLQILNLSHNWLYVMQQAYTQEFEILFKTSVNLKEIYLSHNMLTYVPRNTFTSNQQLEYIDLSNNRLTGLTFDIISLDKLIFIDLSGNRVKTLCETMLRQLNVAGSWYMNSSEYAQKKQETKDQLGTNFSTTENKLTTVQKPMKAKFQVDFSRNDFICNCDDETRKYIEWIKTSKTVYINETDGYTCDLNGQSLNILENASSKISAYCHNQLLLKTLLIICPIIAVTITAAVIAIICQRRWYMNQKLRKNILQQIKNGDFPDKYVVFLSYASEDVEFVRDKIYHQLEEELSKMTQTNKIHVCYGDRDFRPGLLIHNEIVRCLEESAIVVFVVSNDFCRKTWCKMEVEQAYHQQKPIIMLIREHVRMPGFLKAIFNQYVHASWVDDENGGHIEPDWKSLCWSIIELAGKK